MKKLLPFILALFLFIASVQGHVLQVDLTLNTMNNTIYVPSIGELNSSSVVPAIYVNLLHFFVASYHGNALIGLVPFGSKPISVGLNKNEYSHTIRVEQELENSNVFLVFSSGDWRNINKRMDLVESGKFLSEISPSFSFGLGVYHPIKIILEYANINIAKGLVLQRGAHNIAIESNGTVSGVPSVVFSRV
jgi:hypothetical protein